MPKFWSVRLMMFILAFTSPTSGLPLFLARMESGGGLYVLRVGAMIGKPPSVSLSEKVDMRGACSRSGTMGFCSASSRTIAPSSWSSIARPVTCAVDTSAISSDPSPGRERILLNALRTSSITWRSKAMMSAATVNADKKMAVAATSSPAMSGRDTSPPTMPPLPGKARLINPRLERRNTLTLTICIAPNLFSKDWKIITARKRNDSGRSRYPTPNKDERSSYTEAPTAPPVPSCASTKKTAIARRKIALTLRNAPAEIEGTTAMSLALESRLFDFPFFSRSDFFPPLAAIYFRLYRSMIPRPLASAVGMFRSIERALQPEHVLYILPYDLNVLRHIEDRYKSYYGRDKGHKSRSVLQVSRYPYQYQPLW